MVAHLPVISALRRLRQKDRELEANLSYIAGPCSKKQTNEKHFFLNQFIFPKLSPKSSNKFIPPEEVLYLS
jgi:hypothetical protein